MALDEPIKKGGRYTKKEQEERRLKVFKFYFEEGKPATRIAELLRVNRNTINQDIEFWINQVKANPDPLDVNSKMKNQILRMEMQRDRIFEYLEEAETLDQKIKLEKHISEINNRLGQFYSKAVFGKKENMSDVIHFDNSINENKVEEFVKFVISEATWETEYVFSEEDIKYFVVLSYRVEKGEAENMFQKMSELGLDYCGKLSFDRTQTSTKIKRYDLVKFAEMRGYYSQDEVEKIKNEIKKRIEKQNFPKSPD